MDVHILQSYTKKIHTCTFNAKHVITEQSSTGLSDFKDIHVLQRMSPELSSTPSSFFPYDKLIISSFLLVSPWINLYKISINIAALAALCV